MFPFSVEDEPWREKAACRTLISPDTMFPNLDRHDEVVAAKKVCSRCPIADKRDCITAALKDDDHWSISGGMTPKERKKWANDSAE